MKLTKELELNLHTAIVAANLCMALEVADRRATLTVKLLKTTKTAKKGYSKELLVRLLELLSAAKKLMKLTAKELVVINAELLLLTKLSKTTSNLR